MNYLVNGHLISLQPVVAVDYDIFHSWIKGEIYKKS